MRFKNLKTENKKLKERKNLVNDIIEKMTVEQREITQTMKKELFEK
jgi:hypothetical protein